MSRTDGHRPITLSSLLRAKVVDEAGHALGRVNDVRVARDDDPASAGQATAYRVEGLIVGRSGLRARLGLDAARRRAPLTPPDPVLWEDVVALEPGRITVCANRSQE